ncbi:hypothetical protein UFOVP1619_33 [uncultured Caudovirales phage]|uniref:Uncharacterized protein n=1 Tax=uncultured Caudovirales phage TaxID=2100421 RepID=A0A6J5SV43_9CAUD|nr:hypothetical protein UFOVP1619_33 [uncultured Caudovirales phage]
MSQTITVQIKTVYGVDTVYPACPVSSAMAELAGTKTLTAHALRCIERMGFAVAVQAPTYRRA